MLKISVLVADDVAPVRKQIVELLKPFGYDVHEASDGQEARDKYAALRPDIVVADCVMPRQDGFALVREIRHSFPQDDSWCLMLTGKRDDATRLEGYKAGVDDFLLKPDGDMDLIKEEFGLRVQKGISHVLRYLELKSTTVALHNELKQRAGQEQVLRDQVRRDPLTEVANRRALEEDLRHLVDNMKRYGQKACVAMLDIDCFKLYNDTYGHGAGDRALRMVALTLQQHCRGGDTVYRYGGEEFTVLLHGQEQPAAMVAIDRMRQAVQQLALPHKKNVIGVVTVSAGVSPIQSQLMDIKEWLEPADHALYEAKSNGRNRVMGSDPWPRLQDALMADYRSGGRYGEKV